ncbi:MAG: dephospho-CoA kinase [Lachnospiraceae bacterium]|nr:dephospho-CoA kinase [Lachnospiraceae bacterium]
MRLIGITGGVGAGKTEILDFIRRHYRCRIYLADEVAHLIQQPGHVCYDKIAALLGSGVLKEDGSIDRGKMAARIFVDNELLKKVNAIVHPAVREYLEHAVEEARADKETELFFIEAALLIENGYRDYVDEMWYIYAPVGVRKERLRQSRSYSDEKTEQIMQSQLSEERFRQNCDFVINNDASLAEAHEQIKKRLEAYTWQE